MKTVTAFETSDGKVFQKEQDAILHEVTLDKAHEVDCYLSSDYNLYKSTPQRVIARSSILNWEVWKDHRAV
tara:strand:+ start:1448 stop:1660 length:213 start_codon:yes stop_codon:yes gene_type:complete